MASVVSGQSKVQPTRKTDLASGEDLGHVQRTLTGVQVLACGAHVPEEVVRNEDLGKLGYDADWILQRTGILERRRADDAQATSDLALAAARDCLSNARMTCCPFG